MGQNFIPLEAGLKKQGFSLIAGIDEVGRGPLAGPVVSAAVILKDKARLPGLRDSKLLTKEAREKLFPLIIDQCLDFTVAIVSHQTIDEINILEALRWANYLCIENLAIKPDIAVIDGTDKQILDIPFITIIKGDLRVKSIAAASVLAKVIRDRIMTHYSLEYPEYEFHKHMGYSTRTHRQNIFQHGHCEIHRQTFTVKEI